MRAEPEISEVRDCRRPDKTSANPQLVAGRADKQRDGTGQADAAPGRAAQGSAARKESREGVKLEWARIYPGGQGEPAGRGNTNGRPAGRARAKSQRAGCGANRGSDQPWKSERRFCRRSMLPFRGANQLTCNGRVSRVVAVGAERSQSQFAVAVRCCSRIRRRRLTPYDRRRSPARARSLFPVVRYPEW